MGGAKDRFMIFTTSYKSMGMNELLKGLCASVGAKKVIEFGTQQGHSAILLSWGGAKVKTYDLFNEKYLSSPFKKTHANMLKSLKNVKKYNVEVYQANVFKIKPVNCDVLHIDICNHYDNVYPILSSWEKKVKKMIILEGGVYNKWQKKYGFEPFNEILKLSFMDKWNHIVVRGENGYAMTVLTKK